MTLGSFGVERVVFDEFHGPHFHDVLSFSPLLSELCLENDAALRLLLCNAKPELT